MFDFGRWSLSLSCRKSVWVCKPAPNHKPSSAWINIENAKLTSTNKLAKIIIIMSWVQLAQFENTWAIWVVRQPVKVATSHKMANAPRTGRVGLVERSRTRSRTLWMGGWLPDHPYGSCIFKLSHIFLCQGVFPSAKVLASCLHASCPLGPNPYAQVISELRSLPQKITNSNCSTWVLA